MSNSSRSGVSTRSTYCRLPQLPLPYPMVVHPPVSTDHPGQAFVVFVFAQCGIIKSEWTYTSFGFPFRSWSLFLWSTQHSYTGCNINPCSVGATRLLTSYKRKSSPCIPALIPSGQLQMRVAMQLLAQHTLCWLVRVNPGSERSSVILPNPLLRLRLNTSTDQSHFFTFGHFFFQNLSHHIYKYLKIK